MILHPIFCDIYKAFLHYFYFICKYDQCYLNFYCNLLLREDLNTNYLPLHFRLP